MLPYLVIFFLSTVFFYLSSRYEGKWQYVFLLLAILFPSLLAGLRDLTVGRDLDNYVISVWEQVVKSEEIEELLLINVLDKVEVAYILINYLISLFTDDIQWFLFVYQLIIMMLLGVIFLKLKKYGNAHFFMLFYFLYYYCECLSMLRQSIAIVLGVLAVIYLLERKIASYYVICTIAFFLHTSGFILFVIHPLIIIIREYGADRMTGTVLLCLTVLVLLLLFKPVVNYLVDQGLIMEKFNEYTIQEDMRVHKMDLLFLGSAFMFMLLLFDEYSEMALILYYFLLIAIMLTLFGEVTEIAIRMAFYFIAPVLMMIPLLRNDSIEHELLLYLTFVMAFVYFFYQAITTSFADTIPYSSSLLGL